MVKTILKTNLVRNSTSETQGGELPIQRGSNSHTNILSKNLNNGMFAFAPLKFMYERCKASVRFTKKSTRCLVYSRCSSSSQCKNIKKNNNKGGSAPLNPRSYKKNSIIYCRLACQDQLSNKKMRAQLIECRTFASKNNFSVLQEIIEYGSGLKIGKGLKKAMETLKKNKVDTIICQDINRISRNSNHTERIIRLINKGKLIFTR